jgi:hypothetical protein
MGWWADGSSRHGQRVQPQQWPLARALQGQTCQDLIEIASTPDASKRQTCDQPFRHNLGSLRCAFGGCTGVGSWVVVQSDQPEFGPAL